MSFVLALIDEVEIGLAGPPAAGLTASEKSDILADILALETDLATAQADITTIEGDITAIETDIANLQNTTYQFVIDGGGSPVTTGIKGGLSISENGTIYKWRLTTIGGTGSCSIEVLKDTYANYPPADGSDEISGTTGSNNPRISSGTKNESTTMTNWTTAVSEGDELLFNVVSSSTFTQIKITLWVTRS